MGVARGFWGPWRQSQRSVSEVDGGGDGVVSLSTQQTPGKGQDQGAEEHFATLCCRPVHQARECAEQAMGDMVCIWGQDLADILGVWLRFQPRRGQVAWGRGRGTLLPSCSAQLGRKGSREPAWFRTSESPPCCRWCGDLDHVP